MHQTNQKLQQTEISHTHTPLKKTATRFRNSTGAFTKNKCFKKPLNELLGSSTKSSNSPTNQAVFHRNSQSPVNLILPHGTQLLWNLTRETRVSIFSQYPCLSFIGPVTSEFRCQLWAILHKEYRKFHDLLIYCLSHLHFLYMLPSFL